MKYDVVAAVLSRTYKTNGELEIERQAFRSRARRDARIVMRTMDSEEVFLSRLETALFALCRRDIRHPIKDVAEAVGVLTRLYKDEVAKTGTPYAHGNMYMALRSRLVLARYFKRFGWQS